MKTRGCTDSIGLWLTKRILPVLVTFIITTPGCGHIESVPRTSITIKETDVMVGDTFHVEIHVIDKTSRFAQFFIINPDLDTNRLPVTHNCQVGLVDVLCRHQGQKTITGFTRIEYDDPDSIVFEPFHLTINVK